MSDGGELGDVGTLPISAAAAYRGRWETDEQIKQGQKFELQTVIHYKFPITCFQGDISWSH